MHILIITEVQDSKSTTFSSYLWDPHIKWGEFLNVNLLLLVREIKNND